MLALSVAVAAALARTKAMPGGGIRKDAKYANTHYATMYKAYIFDAQTRKIHRYSLRGDVKCVYFRYVKTQGASVAHIVNTSVAWFALGVRSVRVCIATRNTRIACPAGHPSPSPFTLPRSISACTG